jgi:bifunctional DNase/RNase
MLVAAMVSFWAVSAPPVTDYVPVEVVGVMPVGDAHAVFLGDKAADVLVPLSVSFDDAASLHARLGGRTIPLDDALQLAIATSAGQPIAVHIDDGGDRPVAVIVLRVGGMLHELSVPTGDAVALAMASGIPLLMHGDVIRKGSIDVDVVRAARAEASRGAYEESVRDADLRVGVHRL